MAKPSPLNLATPIMDALWGNIVGVCGRCQLEDICDLNGLFCAAYIEDVLRGEEPTPKKPKEEDDA